MISNIDFITKFFTEEYEIRLYGDVDSVDTTFKEVLRETVPKDREGLIIEVAVDNTVDGEIDIEIEGKSALPNPVRTRAFKGNMDGVPVMIKVPPGKPFSLKIRGVGGSITIPWRLVLLLKKIE